MKTACSHCGAPIQYHLNSTGLEVACPHCAKMTRLASQEAAVPPPLPPMPSGSSQVAAQPKKISGWRLALVVAAVVFGVAIPVIGLISSIAIPNLHKAKNAAQRQTCISNLRVIQGAKQNWKIEYNKENTDVPDDSDVFGTNKYILAKLVCPAGGTYRLNALRDKVTCSIPGHTL